MLFRTEIWISHAQVLYVVPTPLSAPIHTDTDSDLCLIEEHLTQGRNRKCISGEWLFSFIAIASFHFLCSFFRLFLPFSFLPPPSKWAPNKAKKFRGKQFAASREGERHSASIRHHCWALNTPKVRLRPEAGDW